MKKQNFILRSELGIAGMLGASVILTPGLPSCAPPEEQKPPNIILIMADDMGFSDIGSYGSEIQTPNLDQLSENGVNFTQFYNQARSCPTRASLLTGLYAHQTGIGNMTSDEGHDSYRGDLNYKCVTMAEALGNSGYSTYMTGKWHVTKHEGYWSGNEDYKSKHNWPLQRGFDKFFGTIIGAGSFFDPITLVEGNEPAELGQEQFYYTDAINDYAVQYIEEHIQSVTDKPFFLYVSHVAPHWPLHALPEDIERYKGIYGKGWDQIRKERFAKMKRIGLIDEDDELTPRDPRVPPWEEEEHQEWRIRAMEVYAAQIDIMDQGIGRIIKTLVQNDLMDNTMIVFLSDNGGCAEILSVEWGDHLFFPGETRDGRPVQIGNDPDYMPGPEETYQSYGIGWANVSNTPFKLYKHNIHEGGIATPLIAHWPKGIKGRGEWREYPSHIIDLMPTFLDIAGAEYPKQFNGEDILPLEGRSLMPYIQEDKPEREDALFWEHNGNRAVRDGKWKLVQRRDRDEWELYNMQADRNEMNDLSAENPGKVRELKEKYYAWADRIGVLPLPRHEHIK
jgi:arylsulfatase A-like enzyme